MKLTNMKSESMEDYPSPCMPNYGYGLTLCLDEHQTESLGITEALKAGTLVTLQAMAIVATSTESVERKGTCVTLSLQITDLGLTIESQVKNAAEILYGTRVCS